MNLNRQIFGLCIQMISIFKWITKCSLFLVAKYVSVHRISLHPGATVLQNFVDYPFRFRFISIAKSIFKFMNLVSVKLCDEVDIMARKITIMNAFQSRKVVKTYLLCGSSRSAAFDLFCRLFCQDSG